MLITLLPETGLADAPAPVLDNQRRPQVDSSGIQQGMRQLASAGQEPMIPMKPFMAPGRGMQAIGAGLGDAGAFLKSVVQEQAKAQNDIDVMQGLSAVSMKIAEASATKDRANPASWNDYYSQVTGDVIEAEIEKRGMSPMAARQFRLQGQNTLNHGRISMATDSATATYKKRDAELESKMYYAVDNREYDAARTLMQQRINNGDATEADMARLDTHTIPEHKKQTERETGAALYRAYQDQAIIVTQTLGAKGGEDLIDSLSHVDPSDKERLKDVVRGVARDKTVALSDEIANNSFSDPTDPNHIHSAHDIESRYANSPFATPEFLANAKADFNKIDALKAKEIRNGPQGFTKFTAAYIDALKWEPPTDPNQAAEQFREKMTNVRAYVPDDYQGEVTSVLHQKFGSQYNATGGKKRPEVLQSATKIMTPQFQRLMAPFNAIYQNKLAKFSEAEKSNGDKAAAMAELDAARRILNNMQANNVVVQANIERELAEWYKKQPKPPTEKEVSDHIAPLLPEGMSVLGLEALNLDDDDGTVGGASMLPAGTIVNPAPPPKKPTSKKESQNPPLPGDDTFVPSGTGPSTVLLPQMAP